MNRSAILWLASVAAIAPLAGCERSAAPDPAAVAVPEYYGTLEPFASEAVYFVVTDRFVDGDTANNHPEQGGPDRHSFDRSIEHPDGGSGNIGYLGGDFAGVLSNAGYIREMGFTAVWITPIVDNPDEAFTGGQTIAESAFPDHGKTGYHGYWGVNFFEVDEHLPSAGLGFAELSTRLRDEHGLKTVLDIVLNHGSPSWTMPEDQPKFGEIYAADGTLVADHQNLPPSELDPAEPLHAFFHAEPDINQLSNLDDTNPAVLDYFAAAYLHWIAQGADAFRIDTIKHMPHDFWKRFSDRIRAEHPDFFMFAESWNYDADFIAEHTWPENGGITVLDFPGQRRMEQVFGREDRAYAEIVDYLHLTDELYRNPYELMTFYDNHDMPRMDADEQGFINANNWLFTSRGIPVVYYGSETGFRAGAGEHAGNRDYFGQENVERARSHPIRAALARIAAIRRDTPALQRGLQANLDFGRDTATFLRVYQHGDVRQTALVALNKGDLETTVHVDRWLSRGEWADAMSGERVEVAARGGLDVIVPANGVRVLLFDGPNNDGALAAELARLRETAERGGARTR